MLVLCRKSGEEIVVPELGLTLRVLEIDRNKVRLGVQAPRDIRIYRRELWERMRETSREPAAAGRTR